MGLVVGDLAFLLFIAVVIATAAEFVGRQRDNREQQAAERLQAEEKRNAELAAKRYEQGVQLICLNCENRFLGPVTEDGCPRCHVSNLVVTLDELKKSG